MGFVEMLALGVEAYEAEDSRFHRAGIESRLTAMLANNSVEVARLLVGLVKRVGELEARVGADGDGMLFWLGERVTSLEESRESRQ